MVGVSELAWGVEQEFEVSLRGIGVFRYPVHWEKLSSDEVQLVRCFADDRDGAILAIAVGVAKAYLRAPFTPFNTNSSRLCVRRPSPEDLVRSDVVVALTGFRVKREALVRMYVEARVRGGFSVPPLPREVEFYSKIQSAPVLTSSLRSEMKLQRGRIVDILLWFDVPRMDAVLIHPDSIMERVAFKPDGDYSHIEPIGYTVYRREAGR